MDHLSNFHLNQTINEPTNTILRKLCRLENWWRPTPRN